MFMMLYAMAYSFLYFTKEVMTDPRDAVSTHASNIGMGLVAMRVIGKKRNKTSLHD